MNDRVVNINYECAEDPRVLEWIEANGIDPKTVPVAQEMLIKDDLMAYVEFTVDEDGKKTLGGDGYLKQIKIVPLISAPENHGL